LILQIDIEIFDLRRSGEEFVMPGKPSRYDIYGQPNTATCVDVETAKGEPF